MAICLSSLQALCHWNPLGWRPHSQRDSERQARSHVTETKEKDVEALTSETLSKKCPESPHHQRQSQHPQPAHPGPRQPVNHVTDPPSHPLTLRDPQARGIRGQRWRRPFWDWRPFVSSFLPEPSLPHTPPFLQFSCFTNQTATPRKPWHDHSPNPLLSASIWKITSFQSLGLAYLLFSS